MTTVEVPIETLEKWQRTLDTPKNPSRACFDVSEEMFDLMQQAPRKAAEQQKQQQAKAKRGLTFSEIVAGDVYEVFNVGGVKYAPLNGKKAKCIQKNRTKVVVTLEEEAGSFKIGHRFTIPPNCLREAN